MECFAFFWGLGIVVDADLLFAANLASQVTFKCFALTIISIAELINKELKELNARNLGGMSG